MKVPLLDFILIKVGDYLNKKKRKEYLNRHHLDLKCPSCNTWLSEKPWIAEASETEMHWHFKCFCGHWSHWGLYAPVPILDENFKGSWQNGDVSDCNSEGEGSTPSEPSN